MKLAEKILVTDGIADIGKRIIEEGEREFRDGKTIKASSLEKAFKIYKSKK